MTQNHHSLSIQYRWSYQFDWFHITTKKDYHLSHVQRRGRRRRWDEMFWLKFNDMKSHRFRFRRSDSLCARGDMSFVWLNVILNSKSHHETLMCVIVTHTNSTSHPLGERWENGSNWMFIDNFCLIIEFHPELKIWESSLCVAVRRWFHLEIFPNHHRISPECVHSVDV